MNVRKNYFL